MNSGIDLSYEDVLKSYQQKSGELLTQLITAEAKLNASAALIISLKERVEELELKNQKSPKKISEDLARHQYYGKKTNTVLFTLNNLL